MVGGAEGAGKWQTVADLSRAERLGGGRGERERERGTTGEERTARVRARAITRPRRISRRGGDPKSPQGARPFSKAPLRSPPPPAVGGAFSAGWFLSRLCKTATRSGI